ncbi:MAG TPA: beta-N-acetylhexosaminidase [Longimicrobium sp.]|nr:beta-N-acetylhexosaminidase [Longimicrobium sp.]
MPDPARYPLIPWPRRLEPREGWFAATRHVRILLPDASDPDVRWVAGIVAGLFAPLDSSSHAEGSDEVILRLDRAGDHGGDEGYRLSVTPERVELSAGTARGLFYAVQALEQLIVREGGDPRLSIPAVEIEDAPRFGWRGMHLDVSRHFFPLSFIHRYVGLLAAYRFNVFHWHLTDDQGWRIEIRRYPRLTEVGAWRKETRVGHALHPPEVFDGTPHGGFYTQADAREVVEEARRRGVTVLPEIEMPGHSRAALAAYPALACTPGPFEVATGWRTQEDILCPGEETFAFLEGVLEEVMELFPSPFIHVGGDEAKKTRWRESPVAQEVIRREGLRDEDELQSWFIRRIERFLNAHGRRLVGWDEILEGGLAPNATVMSWRGTAGGIAAARQGHDVVMTPDHTLYFDHYQGDPAREPLAISGLTTLRHVYGYEPVPAELRPDEAAHVLGAQANVWTEYIATPQHVEYMVLPRMLALAEVLWSPPESRDWRSFRARVEVHLRRLAERGYNARPLDDGED